MDSIALAATVADMTDGQRHNLVDVIDAGLAALGTMPPPFLAAARQLRNSVHPDPQPLDTNAVRILGMLAFAPNGLEMDGTNPWVLDCMRGNGVVEPVEGTHRWQITAYGWRRFRDDHRAAELVGVAYRDVAFDVQGVRA